MPNTKPNLKSKAGNVTHPFSEKTVNAANKIYGAEHEREMPHPLKQQVYPNAAGNYFGKGSAVYNALEQLKAQQGSWPKLDFRSRFQDGGTGRITTVALPKADVQTFDSGSYTNPQGTTDSSANDKSSAFNYSFLEDIAEGPQAKFSDPNRNKFGFWKRDEQSLLARIKDAKKRGKDAKVARLERKLDNFRDNQARRVDPSSDTYQKANPDYDPNVKGSKKTIETDKGGKFANFFKSIF